VAALREHDVRFNRKIRGGGHAIDSLVRACRIRVGPDSYELRRHGIEGNGCPVTASPRITVLYDAFGKDSMTKDWGYAALVEISGKRILFDTGGDPEILAKNAKAKGVDLTKLDFVVLSHRHGDHIGGFPFIRSVNPRVKVYAPKENFGVFGSDLPSTFYRKDASLPAEMRYYGGMPPETMKFGTAFLAPTLS